MKRFWFKTYVEDVFSKTRMQLPDWLFRRLVEFEAFAADFGEDGLLPPVADMAWILRPVDETKLSEALQGLSQVGEVEQTPEGWRLTHFENRQDKVSTADRTRQSRIRNEVTTRNDMLPPRFTNVTDDETKRYKGSNEDETSPSLLLSSESDSLSESEEEEGVGGETDWVPETPAQAMKHPDIKVFKAVCGRIPGSYKYELVIETIRLLRAKHGDNLVDELKPYWLAWSSRKGRNGRNYDPSSLVWLTEWAVNDEIPRANGSEPKTQSNNQDIIRKVAQNAKSNR